MFFKNSKEIEELKHRVSILTTNNEVLKKRNEELSLNDNCIDSGYCASCVNGISYKNEYGCLVSVKCALRCNCLDFERREEEI